MRRTSPKLVGTRTNEPDCLSDEANLAETQPRSAVPIPASTNRANQHCFASLALHTACACGAVGPFASLVTRRRRSLLRFACVAYRACLWRRRSLRFARHRTASLIASLLLRCKRRVPVAPSVPSLRSSQDGVAHCFASRRRRSLLRFSCVANDVCLWRRRSLRFARHRGERRSLLRFPSFASQSVAQPPRRTSHPAHRTAQTCPIGARRESSLHPMRTHIRAHAPRNKSLCGARNTF